MLATRSILPNARGPSRTNNCCSHMPTPARVGYRPESLSSHLSDRSRYTVPRSVRQDRTALSTTTLSQPSLPAETSDREESSRSTSMPTHDTNRAQSDARSAPGAIPSKAIGGEIATGAPHKQGWQIWLDPWMLIEGLFGSGEYQTLSMDEAGAMKHVAGFGKATDKGTRYGTLNQDVAVTKHLPGLEQGCGDVHIGAVMDGHGLLGEVSAKRVGRSLGAFLEERLQSSSITAMSPAELRGMFHEGFQQAHESSLELYNDPPEVYTYPRGGRHSTRYRLKSSQGTPCYTNQQGRAVTLECGTTCTASVLEGNTLALAHVGDSTAMLGFVRGGGYYDAEPVTQDHTCWDEREADRCRQVPGVSVTESKRLRIVLDDLQCHTIAMSRALGHRLLSAEHGLLTTPNVRRLKLEPRHCCLIVASDGVWDNLPAREAVRTVMQAVDNGASAEQAARELTSRAVSAACSAGKGGGADNATAVVYILDTKQT